MNKEIKISIGIIVIGLISLALYWIAQPKSESMQSESVVRKEEILLPKNSLETYHAIPEVKNYLALIKKVRDSGGIVIPLDERELDKNAQNAQKIVLRNELFLNDSIVDGKVARSEMMRILPVLVGSLDEKTKISCQDSTCYQAEKYNFVTNSTTIAVVDVAKKSVLSVKNYVNMQPDISQRLKRIAQSIAIHSPEVQEELGEVPSLNDMSMANVRGALQESPCEDSSHLCVAPTFSDHKKEQALWAIIDLTDLKLVAAKWAGLGKTTTPACISERSLQNRYIMENYCQKDSYISKNGWDLTYRLTGSDGLEVKDASFRGKKVLTSAKIVDWHVSYQQKGGDKLDTTTEAYIDDRQIEFVRGDNGNYSFGYNDAMGCPMFSTSVVLPFNGPQVRELPLSDGFMLTQDFRNPKWPMACNYRYENRFEFYSDGSFRVVGVNKGRGCGDNAIYRPVMRIDMGLGKREYFYEANKEWVLKKSEFSTYVGSFQTTSKTKYPYKIMTQDTTHTGYYIEPNWGQYSDGSRGDNATLFVTRFHESEGAQDLLTLGSCCNLKEDGVERYLENNENIDGEDLVIWYVPRVKNDATLGQEYCWADTRIGDDGNLEVKVWPCIVGPKFIPMTLR